MQPIKKGNANWITDMQLSQSLSSISGEISYPINLLNTHQLYLLVFQKRMHKPSFDRSGWHLQKLNTSKISDVADIRERFV